MVVAVVDKKVVSYGKDGAKAREEAMRLTERKEVYTEFIESGGCDILEWISISSISMIQSS
ncbi:MAG: hypothetical protein QXH35_07950 [Nitrososphaerota archaeon]